MNYKKLVEESGYMKKYIAKQIGVSPTMLSLFLHNKKKLSESRLIKLEEVLGIGVK
jgi:predicted transcriptional regulator